MKSLFSGGYRGLSDSIFSGQRGSVAQSVGIDSRSKPGVLKAHQKLTKDSSTIVDELCKSAVTLKDGKKVWFGGKKAYLDNAGTYSEKLELTKIDRDILFSTQEDTFLGEPSSFIRFNSNGTVAYVSSTSTGRIRQYQLTEAYNLATVTLVYTFAFAHNSFWVSDNNLFILESNSIRVFSIPKGNLISAAQSATFDISAQTTTAIDISFSADGTKLFILQVDGDVHSYDLSVAFGQNMPVFRMLLSGGGGGGGSAEGGGDDVATGGGGGPGGIWEGFEEWLVPGTTYTIASGAGGAGGTGAGGGEAGVNGVDTVSFGKKLLGGGGGGRATKSNDAEDNNGADGASGGGGGEYQEQGDPDTDGEGGKVVDSDNVGTYRQTGTVARLIESGGFNWTSDITGSNVAYGLVTGAAAAGNNNGADATTVGRGGEGGTTNDLNNGDRDGGDGFRGETVLRFVTADVTYTQAGGTVTTDGDYTVIRWETTGTFAHTVSSPLTFDATEDFPAARAFAVESGRVIFTVGDNVVQYTMTAYDFSTNTLSDNVLATNSSVAALVAPRGLFIALDALYVTYETGGKTNLLSVSEHTFVASELNILNSEILTVSVPALAKTKKIYDSLGNTESGGETSFYNGTDTTLSVATNRLLDIYTKNSTLGAAYVQIFNSIDPTQRIRGYATSKSASALAVTRGIAGDFIETENSMTLDTVAADSFILQESIGRSAQDATDLLMQPITLTRDTLLDSVKVKFREGSGINGGYTIKFDIKNGSTVVATQTVTIGTDDIGISESLIDFAFTAVTLESGVRYTFEVSIPSVASLDFSREQNRYVVCPTKERTVADLSVSDVDDVEMQLQMFNSAITEAEADTISEERVYFTTNNMVFYIKASDIAGSWAGKIQVVGGFENGSTVHPMIEQNLSLFIGDEQNVAEINRFGVFTPVTNLNLPKGEKVTALAPFDIDVIVGTSISDYGRALRWDGISDSWSAEDDIQEDGGITAFITDDNFIYPVAGNRGSIYYYNGAKCEDFVTIPEIENQDTIKVNGNAVGYFRGTPLVGISNLSGNPVLQGIYGYGSYNSNYAKSLSLDFPMPSGQFAGVEIGAILTKVTTCT